jgi:hypothetical protein
MASLPDGTLEDWTDLADEYDWQTLLIGNGLSRHIWAPFGYPELFDHAKTADLTNAERKLFESTPNFERVLGDLLTSIRVCKTVGVNTDKLYRRYRNIQKALGQAVRAVHINRDSVPGATRQAIRDVMAEFEWVFTTNYDLLLYWAMAYGGDFGPFIDHFRWRNRCEFDEDRSPVWTDQVPVYFLHGALHLVVDSSGATFKLRRSRVETLLDQFGQPIEGDPDARPLLVTEGSAMDKLEAIEGNDYLSHALWQLTENELDTVVLGSGLGAEDSHLTAALSESPGKTVAVSMMPCARADALAKQMDIYGRVEVEDLVFYDATTHPLGDPALRVPN